MRDKILKYLNVVCVEIQTQTKCFANSINSLQYLV